MTYTYWQMQEKVQKLVDVFEKLKTKNQNLTGVKNDNTLNKRSTNLFGFLDEIGSNPFKVTIGFTEATDRSIKG